MNTDKGLYNIHPPITKRGGWLGLAYLLCICGLLAGFILGWYMYSSHVGDTNNDMTCFVFGFILVIVLKYARNFYLKYESAQLEMEQERVAEAQELTYKQMEIINKQLEMQKVAAKLTADRASTTPAAPVRIQGKTKESSKKYMFTSEDFDNAAQRMLVKPVKSARRAGAKVTGEGLVATFLKGVR